MKKMKRALALLLALTAVLTAFSGCSKKKDEESKDTLIVYSAGAFAGNWDPAGNTILANKHVEWNVFDRLLHKDDDGNYIPGLATEWHYLDDGYTLQLKLREGVKFHDGSDLTAEDVKASVEWTTRPESVRRMDYTVQVLGEVVDDYTVNLYAETKTPLGILLSELAYDPVMSADDIADGTLNTAMNGCGPYKLVRYENETCYLEAFADYWDTENAAIIPKVEYKYVPESATRMYALQDGEAHLVERLEIEQMDALAADKDCVAYELLADEQRLMIFKTTQPPMDNKLLRQAICYAIDTETIVNDIMKSKARVSDSYTSTGNNIYTICEELPTYNPEKAKELLAEAGYPNGEGLEPLCYLTSTGLYPKSKEIAEFIKKCLEDVGIPVDLTVEEVATWEAHLYQEDSCQIIDTGWQLMSGEGNESIGEIFLSPSIMAFSNLPDVDELLMKQTSTIDFDERIRIIDEELYPLLADYSVAFPMYDTVQIYGYSANLNGVEIFPSTAVPFWKISFAE